MRAPNAATLKRTITQASTSAPEAAAKTLNADEDELDGTEARPGPLETSSTALPCDLSKNGGRRERRDPGWAGRADRHARVSPCRFWGEAAAYLDHQHAHDVSSAKTMSSRRSAGGRRWALGVGRCHRQRGGTGRRGGQRGHGRWGGGARGGGGSRHGARSGSLGGCGPQTPPRRRSRARRVFDGFARARCVFEFTFYIQQ